MFSVRIHAPQFRKMTAAAIGLVLGAAVGLLPVQAGANPLGGGSPSGKRTFKTYSFKGHGFGMGRHGRSGRHYGGRVRSGSVFGGNPARSGVRLGSPSGNRQHAHRHGYYDGRHYGYRSGPALGHLWRIAPPLIVQVDVRSDNLSAAIIANGAGDGEAVAGASDGRTYLAESCKPGEYCTIRIGSAYNSPKIITLNETGKTLTPQTYE